MKKIIIIVIVSFCVFVSIVTLYFTKTISTQFMESDPFKVVLQEVSKIDSIGHIDENDIGFLIGGTLTQEAADFNFRIKAPSGTHVVHADLIKNKDQDWEIIKMKIRKK
jgi:hypothetical protein